jgi:hypothetical protein
MHRIAFVSLLLITSLAFAQDKTEFVDLFDGKTLDNWDGDANYWSVQDGAITGKTTAEKPLQHNTFIIWKGGTTKDFELHLKYKISNGNSGVQYRSKAHDDHVVSGYQADIVAEDPDKYSGILYEEKGRGILADRGQAVVITENERVKDTFGDSKEIAKAVKHGGWNEYVITAKGNHITHTINGVKTIEVTDNDEKNAAKEGILALQMHVGPPMTVQFKDIKLKTLSK